MAFFSPFLDLNRTYFSRSFCFFARLISINYWYFLSIFNKFSCSLSSSFSFIPSYSSIFLRESVSMSFRVKGVAVSCPTGLIYWWDCDRSYLTNNYELLISLLSHFVKLVVNNDLIDPHRSFCSLSNNIINYFILSLQTLFIVSSLSIVSKIFLR